MQLPRWHTLPLWIRAILIFGVVCLALAVVVLSLWYVADPRTAQERINTLQIMVAIVGGTVVGVGSFIAWQNLRLNRENLQQSAQMNRETLRITESGQITERFTRAIDQLGSTELEIRLGGIYALERIARDSDRDYQPIMETLTAYLRTHAARTDDEHAEPPLACHEDLVTIVEVIRRRREYRELDDPFRLNLVNTDLRGALLGSADLTRANLTRANLTDANLTGANLTEADFTEADFTGANFTGANLMEANLTESDLTRANLTESDLRGSDLRGAILTRANLTEADLTRANLTEADLRGAILMGAFLVGADLMGSDLRGAILRGADLRGADLRGAILRGATVTKEQLLAARGDETTTHDFGSDLWPATAE